MATMEPPPGVLEGLCDVLHELDRHDGYPTLGERARRIWARLLPVLGEATEEWGTRLDGDVVAEPDRAVAESVARRCLGAELVRRTVITGAWTPPDAGGTR